MALQLDISCEGASGETKTNNDGKVKNADCNIDCKTDGHKNINDKRLNLGEFLGSRLPPAAMRKLKEHLESGELDVEAISQCDEQELKDVAKDYGLNTLQTKAFINAIKKLPNSKVSKMGANVGNINSVNGKSTSSKFISDNVNTKWSSDNSDNNSSKDCETKETIDRILAQELEQRAIQDRLNGLCQLLDNQKQANAKWITENTTKNQKNNEKLDKIGNELKKHIDTIISKLKTKQFEDFENYKTQIMLIEEDFKQEYKNIRSMERKLKERYTRYITTDLTSLRSVIDRLISQSIAARELYVIKDIIDIKKSNSERINDIATNIEKQINGLVDPSTPAFSSIGNPSPTHKISVTSQQQETVPFPEIPLHKLDTQSQLQVKLETNEYKHEEEQTIIARKGSSINCNQVDWRWDYCSKSNGFWTKHVKNDQKTFACSAKGLDCRCFARCNTPMKPNSGIYKIKFKIDKISNKRSLANIIGITCNTDNNNNWHEDYHYWYYSNEYIGWSSYEIRENDTSNSSSNSSSPDDGSKYIRGGLLCGSSMCQKNNIFYSKPVKYQSYISKYKTRLPCLKSNDIVILEYDSDHASMRFGKKSKFKDDDLNSIMIACLNNLPTGKTFYWMVGHEHDPMVVNIIDD